jgi:hypothetical protein
MSREEEKDKLVLRNLDRIVSGDELQDESELDEETRKTLELTREMTKWSKSPHGEFKRTLKAQLIHQLSEREKQEDLEHGDFELRQFLRRPAWQLTLGTIIAVIITVVIFLIVNALQT